MPGIGLETSMIEMTERLLTILLMLVGISVIAGILTLPVFFGTLVYKNAWFWASDVNSGSLIKRFFAKVMRFGFPAFSLFATIVGLGNFGAFDYPYRLATGLSPLKTGPTQRLVKDNYDEAMNAIGKIASPALPNDVAIDWARTPQTADALIALNAAELAPPAEQPIDKMFPPPQNSGEPPPSFGPPETPKAVIKRVGQIIKSAQDGSLYQEPPSREMNKLEILAINDLYERAVKDSKWKQDGMVRQFRAISLYLLLILGPIPLAVFSASWVFGRRGVVLVMRSLTRALMRTSLTYLAVFVLVFMLCCIWSVLSFLDFITKQQEGNLRGIITEKYQIPSQMKPSHLGRIKDAIAELPKNQQPEDIEANTMTWAFVLTTHDPTKMTFQNVLFMIATEPEKVLTMITGLDDLSGEELAQLQKASAIMKQNPRAVVIGAERLRQLGKRVGDRMEVTSLNYKGIKFDLEIVGELPAGGRWESGAFMNRKYLDNEMDAFKGRNGKEHELSEKSMNLIWVKLPNMQSFDALSEKLSDPGKFSPAVKIEIESSAYANFLSPYKTLVSFLRYALAPGLLVITTLVSSLVIGIGVRERKTEIAVLKVLGFRPWMVLGLVLGEALLVGTLSGFMATATAYSMVNAVGGIPLPIGFFGKFFVPEDGLWWGPAIGATTSLIGAILPSMTAYRIKASQVFSRVT